MTASVTGSPRNASASVRSFCRIIALISGGAYSLSPAFTRTSPFGPSTTSYGTIFISSLTSPNLRPMNRLIEKMVFCGFVTCWRFAGAPTSRWPSLVNATTDGVVRPPSAFGITAGSPASITAIAELVVPRSMPIVFAIAVISFVVRKSQSDGSNAIEPAVLWCPLYDWLVAGEPSNERKGGFLAFWTTLPGILTGVAALITAIVGVVGLWKSQNDGSSAPTTAAT